MIGKAALALLLAVGLTAPAEAAKLRPVTKLKATALEENRVRLTWRDRSRGETRYEVRRAGLTRTLKRNARRWTGRRAASGRYRVRACTRRRCARFRSVRLKAPPLAEVPEPGPGPGPTPGAPQLAGCPMFPADNPWNTDVSRLPVETEHDYIGSLAGLTLWPDFGGAGAYGIPFTTVPAGQPAVPMAFAVPEESEPGPYPIPLGAPVEGGSDRHVLVLQQGSCRLFELFDAERDGPGWRAYSGAVFDLRSNGLRPDGWTSADAAGLPMLPGLARRDEVERGAIRHALRITVPVTQRAYIKPATHFASDDADRDQPPMGLRVRLKADYDISGFGPQARVVAQALKTYGALVADNAGSPRVYISGAVDAGWDDEDLGALKRIPASALEAVRTGPVIRPAAGEDARAAARPAASDRRTAEPERARAAQEAAADPAYAFARALGLAGPRPATGAGERRAHAKVEAAFRAAGLRVGFDRFAVPGKGRSRNVVGILDRPARCLQILMAHADTVPPSPGAHDNASGVGTLVALAPRLAALAPRCDVWLVATGAEERIYTGRPDHLGASALVPRVAGLGRRRDLRWALSLDEVGRGRAMWLRSPASRSLERAVVRAARGTGLTVRWVADGGSGNSDHREFGLAGLVAAKLGVPAEPARHTAGDTVDRLSPGTFPRVRALVERLLTG